MNRFSQMALGLLEILELIDNQAEVLVDLFLDLPALSCSEDGLSILFEPVGELESELPIVGSFFDLLVPGLDAPSPLFKS